jgi:ATP-dependent DNA ligase
LQATRAEQDFLARLLMGQLRQGALEGIVVEAIAKAASVPASDIRRAAMLAADIVPVARSALTEGAKGLQHYRLELLKPAQPMLADIAEDVGEALAYFRRASFEYKLDGARVQVHKDGTEVRVFTRSLNEVTDAVPEVVELLRRLPAQALIANGEALAFNADGTPSDDNSIRRTLPQLYCPGRKWTVTRRWRYRAYQRLEQLFDALYLRRCAEAEEGEHGRERGGTRAGCRRPRLTAGWSDQ